MQRAALVAVVLASSSCTPEAAVEIRQLEATSVEDDATCGIAARDCRTIEGTFVVKNVGAATLDGITGADAAVDDLRLDFPEDVGDSSPDRAPCKAGPWDLAPGRTSEPARFRLTTSSARQLEQDPNTYFVALFLPCGDGEASPTLIERESMVPLDGELTLELAGVVDTGATWAATAAAAIAPR